MKITEAKLEKLAACSPGVDWFKAQKETDAKKVIKALLDDNHFNWANWLIVRLMSKKDKVRYAIYAAKSVIEIYEKKYPDDKRPREAIKAAEKWVKNPSEKNRDAAAAYAADAADAAYAADAAAYAADAAAYATRRALQIKIINYGLKLIN